MHAIITFWNVYGKSVSPRFNCMQLAGLGSTQVQEIEFV